MGKLIAEVEAGATAATAIACTVSSIRGIRALSGSNGLALTLSDEETGAARDTAAKAGLWPEFSSAIALAGIKKAVSQGESFDGPTVAIQTSTGLKDSIAPKEEIPKIEPEWDRFLSTLRERCQLSF